MMLSLAIFQTISAFVTGWLLYVVCFAPPEVAEHLRQVLRNLLDELRSLIKW